jgi:hypothetical protein
MIENVLGAVAVMYVRIDDRHPPQAVVAPQVLDHHRLDVDRAEAPRPVDHPHRVMAWRPHQGERPRHLAPQHRLGGRYRPAGRHQVGVSDMGSYVGHADVDPVGVLNSRQPGLVLADAGDVEQALLDDLVAGEQQPLLPLGMGRRDRPVERREKDQAERLHGHRPPPSAANTPGFICSRQVMILPVVLNPLTRLNSSS